MKELPGELRTRPDHYIACVSGDFRFFLWELWKERHLDRKAPLGRVEMDAAAWAAGESTPVRRRGVLAPRGVGKTYFGTCALAAYRLRRDRQRKILIPSKNATAMKEVISELREWIDAVWFLQDLQPGKDDRDTTTWFDVAGTTSKKQPSVKSIGNEGMLEGNRAHSIFPDDIETKVNTKTVESRQELERLANEYINILYPDLPEDDDTLDLPVDPSEVVVFGTVKHEETVYLKLQKKGYSFRTWTLAYPSSEEIKGCIGLSPMLVDDLASGKAKVGEPTIPRRFGIDNVAEKMASGRNEWLMEHMLQVNLAQTNRYPLRLSDLIVMDCPMREAPVHVTWGTQDHSGSTAIEDIACLGFGNDRLHRPAMISKEWAPYTATKGFVDPAGRGDDKTGFGVASVLGGLYWLRKVIGIEGGASNDKMDQMIELGRDHGVTEFVIEDNADALNLYVSTFEARVRAFVVKAGDTRFPKGWAATVTRVHATGQKEVRIIEAIEPLSSTHRLIVDRSVVENEEFQRQYTRLNKERGCLGHEDEIDATAGVLKALHSHARINPEQHQERDLKKRKDRIQDEFRRQWGLKTKELPRW